jgi:transcriptional regulator with XRE-family HTH domain
MDYAEIGAWLKEQRKSRRLTQAQVGQRLGITNQAVSLIESGKSQAPLPRLQEFARVVGGQLEVLVASRSDRRSILAVQFVEALPTLDPAIVDALEAWVDLWQRQRDAAADDGVPTAG